MSWFTNLFSKPKKSVKKSDETLCEEDKPFTAGPYLGFYNDNIVFYNETFAKRSLLTGKYIHITEFKEKEGEMAFLRNIDESFNDFSEAYDAFCDLVQKSSINDSQLLGVLNSLVIMFNKQYSSIRVLRSRTFARDYPRYFLIVRYMLYYNLPLLIKADLYRQISFFKKSVELLNGVEFETKFERELCDEIRFRACNNIRHPFMICDVENLRPYSEDLNRPTNLDWFFDVHYRINLGTPIYRTARGGGN